MMDLHGTSLSAEEAEKLVHPLVGGVILFSRNYEGPEQVANLISDIRKRRRGLLVAVDHEGGRVQRFRAGFTRLPAASAYGENLADDPTNLHASLQAAGWLMAAELRSIGVDFSFAPVLDVDSGISAIIGDRSFSRDGELAALWASNFACGLKRAGMAAVGKHFPGHGGVAPDSHLALPVDPRSYEELDGKDLIPFKRLIADGIEGIMPSHVIYSALDERPAGFSPFWIRTVLRTRLGFAGAVFSDDLSMKAAESIGGWTERAEAALSAGCDMALICNNPSALDTVLDHLRWQTGPDHARRLAAMTGRFAVDRNQLLSSTAWKDALAAVQSVQRETA